MSFRDLIDIVEGLSGVEVVDLPRGTVRIWRNPNRRQLNYILTLHNEARYIADDKQVWAWDGFESEHDGVIRYLVQQGLTTRDDLIIDIVHADPRSPTGLTQFGPHMNTTQPMIRRMVGRK